MKRIREVVIPAYQSIEAKIEDSGAISLSQDTDKIYFGLEDIEDVVDLIRSVDPRHACNTKETPHE